MHRFASPARTAALLVLLGLLLAACRVPDIPTTAVPSTTSYPGPASQRPTVLVQPPTVPLPPASLVPTAASTTGATDATVTILHTGEVAGEVVPCGWTPRKGGLARRATAITQLRAQAEGTVLVLDSGNTLFGKDPSNSSQGAVQIRAMNLMGYDALAIGENDLAVPATVLQERFQEARFAALSTNLGPADSLPIQPYLLKQVDGHTAAILGATAPNAAKRTQPGIPLTVESPVQAISRTVAGLRGQADIIIVLSNLSVKENEAIATTVPGVDVILGSHDSGAKMGSRAVAGPEGQVVLAVTYRLGQFLGMLTVHFDAAGHVVNFSGQDLALLEKYANDPAMVDLLAEYGVKP